MLSEVSPFSPMKSVHQLGRDAVALDHALAVVDARVGDPARGRHDPHAAVRRRSW